RQAEKVRAATWRNDKQTMELSIPLFEALIHADPSYHRDHGQLGYALKDKADPEYERAIGHLSEAIRLRDALGSKGYRLYELNRAECWIRSKTGTTQAILRDLRAATAAGLEKQIFNKDIEHISEWLKSEKFTKADLLSSSATPSVEPQAQA
ncbi:MAG: hypothetical protein AAGD38_22565, partial [Acidobacteriota bacterium]